MIGTLYLPYFPEGGVAGSENDMTDEEYANALLNQFGKGYNSFMDRALANASDDRYNMMEIMPEEYQIKGVKDSGKVDYYPFGCEVNDEEDKPMSDSELDYYTRSGEMCAVFIHMLVDGKVDPDGISEMNYWLKDSRGIMTDPNIDESHKVGMLPAKDLLLYTNGRKYVLTGSRVIDQDNVNNFAIIVNKVKNS